MSAGEAVWLGGYIRDCLELFLEIVLVCNKMLALAVCAAPSRHANWESIVGGSWSGEGATQTSSTEAVTHSIAHPLSSLRS